jgi:hypothetical protein
MDQYEKKKWLSGRDLVEVLGMQGFELFDLMKKGLQPYTGTGKKVIDSDPLPRGKRDSFEEIWAKQKAKHNACTLGATSGIFRSEAAIEEKARRIYNGQPLVILNPPKDCELMSFTLPSNDKRANEVISKVLCFLFRSSDVVKFEVKYNQCPAVSSVETQNGTTDLSVLSPIARVNMAVEPQKMSGAPGGEPAQQGHRTTEQSKSLNFLTREGDFWHIGFEGKETTIRHLDGLLYISYLLENKRPGEPKSISCRDLYLAGLGVAPVSMMSKGTAIDEGLNIRSSKKQPVANPKTRKICREEYEELEERLLDAGMEEQEEIQERMNSLMCYLNIKERNFADSDEKKAQTNITKRMQTAYNVIGKQESMKKMAKHLRDNIKPDGAYGIEYRGNILWDITS